MEYNNHVICGIFHVRTNFYENLEYVLGNLTSPLRKRLDPDRNKKEKKTLLFQDFVLLGLVFVHQTFF